MISIFSFSGLVIAIPTLALCLLVLFRANKKIHYIWSLFCLAVFMWGVGVFFIGISDNPKTALYYWKIAYLGVLFIPPLYLHFIYELLEKRKDWILHLSYFLSLVLSFFMLFTPYFIKELDYLFNSFFYLSKPSLLYNLFVISFFTSVVYAIYLLKQKFMQNSSRHKKKQIKTFLLATYIGYSGGFFAFLPVYNIEIYPVLNILIGVFPVIITYSVFRHRFMDLRFVAQRGLVYSLLLGIIIGAYLLSIVTLEMILGKDNEIVNLFTGVILIVLGIYGVPIIERFFRKKTDKIFFKDKYDLSEALYSISEIININIDIETLLREINREIKRILRVDAVATVFIKDKMILDYRGDYQRVKYQIPETLTRLLSGDRISIVGLEELRKIRKNREALGDGERLKVYDFILETCIKDGAELVVPVYLGEELLAVTLLKKKKSGDGFDQDDFKFLRAYSFQAGVAIEKARLYTEIKGYSVDLESKVKERTREIMGLQEKQKQIMNEMAHGMQTPLTILKSELSSLADGVKDKKRLKTLEKLVDRISYLIYNMLRLAKLDSEGENMDKEKFNLSELILELMEEFEIITADKKIKIVPDIEKDIFFHGSFREMEELINNLVSNSVKYIGEKADKKIELELKRKKGEILLRVFDNGIGIAKKDQENLFDRFYRVENDKSSFVQGTGLGLAIVKKIAERHAGQIELRSELGVGTELLIRFKI